MAANVGNIIYIQSLFPAVSGPPLAGFGYAISTNVPLVTPDSVIIQFTDQHRNITLSYIVLYSNEV